MDFKAFRPNLLSNELGFRLLDDPYDLGKLVLPDIITTKEQQRAYVKLLVLMGINADSDKKAYQGFRNSDRKNKLGQSLTDIQLATILEGFINKHPQFKGVLNTGQALRLMNIDSQIADMVLDYFTNKDIPVLCIHDRFKIQYDKEPELRRIPDITGTSAPLRGSSRGSGSPCSLAASIRRSCQKVWVIRCL